MWIQWIVHWKYPIPIFFVHACIHTYYIHTPRCMSQFFIATLFGEQFFFGSSFLIFNFFFHFTSFLGSGRVTRMVATIDMVWGCCYIQKKKRKPFKNVSNHENEQIHRCRVMRCAFVWRGRLIVSGESISKNK